MCNNNTIVAKNGYELLKTYPVKTAILQEIMRGSKPVIVDDDNEYINICQKLNVCRNQDTND